MKLHALKAVSRARREQDWADIVGVIRATNQAIEDTELREIIERYGPSGHLPSSDTGSDDLLRLPTPAKTFAGTSAADPGADTK